MAPYQELGKIQRQAIVESQRWFNWGWSAENTFYGETAYTRALEYAYLLKNPEITECCPK